MGSLSEQDRLKRLKDILTAWQWLLEQPPRSGAVSDEQREQELINHLVPIAAPEVYAAYVEDPAACVYCDLFSMDDAATMKARVLAVIPKGMKRAGRTYTEKHAKFVGEHVKNCIAAELAELGDRLRVQAQKKEPKAFLSAVLEWPRPNAALLLEGMTFKQRSGMLELLFAHTGTREVALGDQPEDEVLWRLWYAGVLQVTDPAVRDVLEEEDRPAIILLGEAWGTPLPPETKAAGALYAKYYQQLARELSNSGQTVRDPASVSRIARLTGKSRSTIDRYLASDAEITLTARGSDVRVHFTPADIQRSIDAVRGKKRGPKS